MNPIIPPEEQTTNWQRLIGVFDKLISETKGKENDLTRMLRYCLSIERELAAFHRRCGDRDKQRLEYAQVLGEQKDTTIRLLSQIMLRHGIDLPDTLNRIIESPPIH
jgi:hypothetical protein